MKTYFTISEFVIDKNLNQIPLHVADKIVEHHISIINPIRVKKGSPIYVPKIVVFVLLPGKKRMDVREILSTPLVMARSTPSNGGGASDYTCAELDWLFEELKQSSYRRVCIYRDKKFIHADHKGHEKLAFESINGVWKRVPR